jgi:hypothetical protein
MVIAKQISGSLKKDTSTKKIVCLFKKLVDIETYLLVD